MWKRKKQFQPWYVNFEQYYTTNRRIPSPLTYNIISSPLLTSAGNREFREIVAVAIPGYVNATSRSTKSEIVTDIVRQVRENGGRFLKRDGKRNVWYVLNYTQSKEKAGHAIRDATITEDSKKERAQKRKLQRAAYSSDKSRSDSSSSPVSMSDTSDSESDEDYEKVMGPLSKEFNMDHVQAFGMKQDPPASFGSLTSIFMANFPTKILPEDVPSNSVLEPLPIDDPFNSYIDQLLGPLTDF